VSSRTSTLIGAHKQAGEGTQHTPRRNYVVLCQDPHPDRFVFEKGGGALGVTVADQGRKSSRDRFAGTRMIGVVF